MDDLFKQLAYEWKPRCTHDREYPELERLLRDYDSTLRLRWDAGEGRFWVGKIVPDIPYELVVPLRPIGENPHPDEVLAECQRRHHALKRREALKRVRAEAAGKRRAWEAEAAAALPGFSSYMWDALQFDDTWARREAMEGMRREAQRNGA